MAGLQEAAFGTTAPRTTSLLAPASPTAIGQGYALGLTQIPDAGSSYEDTLRTMQAALQQQMAELKAKGEESQRRVAELERESTKADHEREQMQRREIRSTNNMLIADKKAREEAERKDDMAMAIEMQKQAAWEMAELNKKAEENVARLKENAAIDMERVERKRLADRTSEAARYETSLISAVEPEDPYQERNERRQYANDLQRQTQIRKQQQEYEKALDRQEGWTSLPMQPAYSATDSKVQYRAELLGQMAYQRQKTEVEKNQEKAKHNQERQMEEQRMREAEAEHAMKTWLQKEEVRNSIRRDAEFKQQQNRNEKLAERELEATVMARSQQEYMVQMSEAQARKEVQREKINRELQMQMQYTKMVKESQKELDRILSKLGSTLM